MKNKNAGGQAATKVGRQKKVHETVAFVLGVSLAVFQVYTALFGSFDALFQRITHLGLSLLLIFLTVPPRKARTSRNASLIGIFLPLLVLASLLYLVVRYDWVTAERFTFVTPLSWYETVLGSVFVLLCLESVRRIVGLPLFCVALLFLIYPLVGHYLPTVLHTRIVKWGEIIDFNYLSLGGIFGIPLGVSATEIAVFIIFGSVMMHTGGSQLINSVALAIAGNATGGPAKVAVVASSLFGTISGSGVANVATTGCITIPMMKKAGYRPHFAGAVEAVASTGGQIMPPVMGAAAFVMAAFSGVPYSKIILHAMLPAILYYMSLFYTVHFEAKKLNLQPGLAEISLKEAVKGYGHMILPIMSLIYFLVKGFTPRFSAGVAVITALLVCQTRKKTRLPLSAVFNALYDGAKSMLIVVTSCAAAGIIVGSIDMTGLGPRFGSIFVYLSGGNLEVALFVAATVGIILGMGLPTTPAYIVQVATIIPALIKLGVPTIGAHFFAFYYSCLSLITPPVAAAAYTAASIANSDGWKTGWTAFRLGFVAYIVPFIFVFKPTLLFVGPWTEVLIDFLTACIGVYFLSASFEGFMFERLSLAERVVAFASGVLLVIPTLWISVAGGILASFIVLLNYKKKARKKSFVGG
jgi:TRAP transporter 4TM/12TM fusion protein